MTYRNGNRNARNIYRVGPDGEQHIGVMFTAEDAALIVEALNRETWSHVDLDAAKQRARVSAEELQEFVADSCTGCTAAKGDPDCPVHHGRKPRGPKPPPLGEGCICDGSGRTCPRHGAVI